MPSKEGREMAWKVFAVVQTINVIILLGAVWFAYNEGVQHTVDLFDTMMAGADVTIDFDEESMVELMWERMQAEGMYEPTLTTRNGTEGLER